MSLKAFHIFFIAISTLMCFGIAAWRLSSYFETGELNPLAQGAAAGIAGVILLVYGIGFMRKFKELSYL